VATIESGGRFSLVLALVAVFLAGSSVSWSADDLWNQHMHAGEMAYRSGLEQKYQVGWGRARPTLGFTEAEEQFLDAIAVAQGLPDGDLRKAEAMSALAGTYTEEGRFSDAENSGNQAVAIVEASVPSDDPRLGAALVYLAVIYDAESRPERAAALWDRALPILKKVGGVDHEVLQQLTFTASNLAGRVNPDGPAQMFRAILELSEVSGASDNDLRILLQHLAALRPCPPGAFHNQQRSGLQFHAELIPASEMIVRAVASREKDACSSKLVVHPCKCNSKTMSKRSQARKI